MQVAIVDKARTRAKLAMRAGTTEKGFRVHFPPPPVPKSKQGVSPAVGVPQLLECHRMDQLQPTPDFERFQSIARFGWHVRKTSSHAETCLHRCPAMLDVNSRPQQLLLMWKGTTQQPLAISRQRRLSR